MNVLSAWVSLRKSTEISDKTQRGRGGLGSTVQGLTALYTIVCLGDVYIKLINPLEPTHRSTRAENLVLPHIRTPIDTIL